MATRLSERDAESYLQSTVAAMSRIMTHSITSKKASEEISFVAETLASYLLEEGADDFHLDLELLLQDAGLVTLIDDDDEFDALVESLGAMMDPSQLGSDFEELPDYSSCDMCERHMKLTFHHLIPKELHRKYIKKNRLPSNLTAEPGFKMGAFLGNFGAYLCRPCHSAVHRCEPNRALAEEYNTIDRLLAHPKIGAWAAFNSKQKVREK
ncbi:hypothetical protein TrCOL_g6640 [Triparma columacea]|uniref:Uncharacterized protein n=1 Tax=Triparma columacea TaxID=722753 RepID=A0A9W7GFF5_9STRA|nr:hypothetical protein TrCOL_g6640 [Triparma columacea]